MVVQCIHWQDLGTFAQDGTVAVFVAANTEIMQDTASVARCGALRFPSLQVGEFDYLAFDDILF